jgi:hypothetical protein
LGFGHGSRPLRLGRRCSNPRVQRHFLSVRLATLKFK